MGKGIRQDCHLSTYIFVLCIERLAHLIDMAVGEGKWRPMHVGQQGLSISHILFMVDLLLFAEVSIS